ncbi:MAG: glycosyltransferase [Phycisphaerales bacterium]
MPLCILHISTRLILGGSQENTLLSCEGQARLGHDVHLAFGPIFGPEGSMLDRVRAFNERVRTGHESGATEIVTHELPHMVREIDPIKDHLCFHRDLKRLLRDVRPDVVHTHSSKAGILGRWAAWKANGISADLWLAYDQFWPELNDVPPRAARKLLPAMRIVHTIHGPPFMPVEGPALARAKTRLKNHLYTLAERFAARRCHTIVSVADAMTEQFLARGIGRRGQYVTVRSGMPVEPFLHPAPGETREDVRRELGVAPTDFVLGTVARLAEHKGHDDVLDALAGDLRANPHWKLLWVGDGWWRERLLARVESLGVRAQVVTTGLVAPERIPALMRAMDVLIHPSYREGLPRTVPQALLAGVPVVASDADGTPEVCLDPARVGADNATGRLFPVGDATALGEAVRWMANHDADRRAMGERGRAMCREMFSAERMVKSLERVYADALAKVRAPGLESRGT